MSDYAPLELDHVQIHRHWSAEKVVLIQIVREEAVKRLGQRLGDQVALEYARANFAATIRPAAPPTIDFEGFGKALREAIHGPDDESEDT